MGLNRNQLVFLYCPGCGEDVKKSIQWLYENSIVSCNSGRHDLSRQAAEVVQGLKNAEAILEQDLKNLRAGK